MENRFHISKENNRFFNASTESIISNQINKKVMHKYCLNVEE